MTKPKTTSGVPTPGTPGEAPVPASPTVDIALPVYNGEPFLEEALQSILAQDYPNFRVLISDNASSDRTEEICRSYAATDVRIVYSRQASNIGAAPNFNVLFEQATARYFKWHAADDLMTNDFISRCVDLLEADDDVVLAFSQVEIIDANGAVIRVDDPAKRVGFNDRLERWAHLVQFDRHPCFEIFGLFRRSALQDTDLIASFSGGDRNLLAHIALRGRFAIEPAPLFQQRRHPNQSVQMTSNKLKYDEWFDPKNAGKARLPEWNRYVNYAKSARREPIGWVDRAKCFGHLGRQMCRRWRFLAGDLKRLSASRKPLTARS